MAQRFVPSDIIYDTVLQLIQNYTFPQNYLLGEWVHLMLGVLTGCGEKNQTVPINKSTRSTCGAIKCIYYCKPVTNCECVHTYKSFPNIQWSPLGCNCGLDSLQKSLAGNACIFPRRCGPTVVNGGLESTSIWTACGTGLMHNLWSNCVSKRITIWQVGGGHGVFVPEAQICG